MENLTGKFIEATSLLDDTVFKNTVVFIIEQNEKGVTGFIINKPFHRHFNELVEFRHSPALPLFYGGPVDEEGLFFLHKRPDVVGGATKITTDIYYAGNFAETVKAVNNSTIKSNEIKLIVGYCGWDAEQLEEEIAEGSWELTTKEIEIFTD